MIQGRGQEDGQQTCAIDRKAELVPDCALSQSQDDQRGQCAEAKYGSEAMRKAMEKLLAQGV